MNRIDVSKNERAVIIEALKVWLDPIIYLFFWATDIKGRSAASTVESFDSPVTVFVKEARRAGTIGPQRN